MNWPLVIFIAITGVTVGSTWAYVVMTYHATQEILQELRKMRRGVAG